MCRSISSFASTKPIERRYKMFTRLPTYDYLLMYRRPSLFAVFLFAVLNIRGPENREIREFRGKNTVLAQIMHSLVALIFANYKFLWNGTPRIARETCTNLRFKCFLLVRLDCLYLFTNVTKVNHISKRWHQQIKKSSWFRNFGSKPLN